MKKIFYLLLIVTLSVVFTSCDQLFGSKEGPNDLGGNTNVDYAQPGSTFTGSIKIGDNYLDVINNMAVTKNDNGIATIHINAKTKDITQLQPYLSLLPPSAFDDSGNISADFKLKITTDGIQDYFNKDGKAHTIVKYNSNVGDKYQLTKSDGTTITRTVTGKDTSDVFPWGLYLIKTITVEQDSRIPGISKIIMKANHKFGLVFISFVMDDNSIVSSVIL